MDQSDGTESASQRMTQGMRAEQREECEWEGGGGCVSERASERVKGMNNSGLSGNEQAGSRKEEEWEDGQTGRKEGDTDRKEREKERERKVSEERGR